MGETITMTTAPSLQMGSSGPTKPPVPCAFPAMPRIPHQAVASVPLPAAVPQEYLKNVCMPMQPAPQASPVKAAPTKQEDDEKTRVTVWNPTTGKKLSGNAGVQKKNLAKYLRTHPDWVVWNENHRHALKRKRIDMELERARQQRQKIEVEVQITTNKIHLEMAPEESISQSMLWAHLLAVCSEEYTHEEDEDHDICSPPRCAPGSLAKGPLSEMAFVPGGLTSPAVG